MPRVVLPRAHLHEDLGTVSSIAMSVRGECGFMKLMKLKKRGKISDVLLTAIITY